MEVDGGVLHGRHIYERSHQQAWKEESLQGSEGGRPRRSGDRIFVTEFAFWEEYHGGIFQGTGESQGAIENMTGLSVADVNIKVAGVDDDTEN